MKKRIITIDGPAGAGKSTIARELAEVLRMPYLDTGAMFRFLAWQFGDMAQSASPEDLAEKAAKWTFSLEGTGNATRLLVNGQPMGEEIRSNAVSRLASTLATSPVIRQILRQAQQKLGLATSLVAEGRDLGTVVFPGADHKFFLDASPQVRAKRRWLQLQEKETAPDLEEVTAGIIARDSQDANRPIAPLKPAQEAVIIDSSDLNINAVLEKMLAVINKNA